MSRFLSLVVLLSLCPANATFADWPCACNADVDGDGWIDDVDQGLLEGCLGSPPIGGCEGADVNCDGWVDGPDEEAWLCMDMGEEAGYCCPYALDLTDFPMHEAQGPDYHAMTGAAALQMALNWLHWDSTQDPVPPSTFDDQTWLYDYAHARNADGTIDNVDIQGMLDALQELRPLPFGQYGYNFAVVHGTDANELLAEIAQWLDYPVGTFGGHQEGHPEHVAVLVPAFGGYSNWMVIRGVKTDQPAYPLPGDLSVWGYYVNDPYPTGLGEFIYVDEDIWVNSYYLPLTSNDAYNGEYVAIVGMPDQSAVPTVSAWGMVAMALLVLTAGTLVHARRPAATSV